MEGGEGPGRGAHSAGDGDGNGEAEGTATGTATRAAATATDGDGGGDDGAEEKKQRENELTNLFEVFSYIEPTFSTGWSHQPILMALRCHPQCATFSPTSPSEGQPHWFINPAAAAPSSFSI